MQTKFNILLFISLLFIKSIQCRGKNIGAGAIETRFDNGNRRIEVTAYANAKSGEKCEMSYTINYNSKQPNLKTPCPPPPKRSTFGNYACRIISYEIDKVTIELVDFIEEYAFRGTHVFTNENCKFMDKQSSKVRLCNKSDFWKGA